MIAARLLNQFIAVAEELHFGRAAGRLHMAQPPLSLAIKHLEAQLGVTLFARNRHEVRLTAAGQVFLIEAKRLLQQGQRAVDATRRASEGSAGQVTLGFVGSVSYELLPRILHAFRDRHPNIHVDLRELISIDQIKSLRNNEIDLGLVRLPLGNAADFTLQTVATERFVAVLPASHPLAHHASLTLRQLQHEHFMVFPPDRIPSLHAKFMFACAQAGFSPSVTMEAWQMSSMVSLVAAGMGVALLPAQVQCIPHPGVVCKGLDDVSEHLELEIAVASRPDEKAAGVTAMRSVLATLAA